MIHFVVMSAGWFKHSYRHFSQISIEVMIWYCSHFWMFFYRRNPQKGHSASFEYREKLILTLN